MKNNSSFFVLGHTITPQEVSGNYDMVIGITPPNVPGPPPHFHSGYDEVFFVLDGSMNFMVDGQQKIVGTGEMIDLPKNTLHTFSNEGNKACKWINIHSPKGFLSFFEQFAVACSEESGFQKSIDPKIIDQVMKTAADYDMNIRI